MERSDPRYQAYVEILKEELIPAMGCTEPIALAYAAARAREVLGALPESVQLQVSGSIIKNVKSVIVPNTGHLKGMEAAVAAGIIAGSAEKELEVISLSSSSEKPSFSRMFRTDAVVWYAVGLPSMKDSSSCTSFSIIGRPSMDLSIWMLLFYFCCLRFAIAGPAGGEEFVLHCAGSIVYYSCW